MRAGGLPVGKAPVVLHKIDHAGAVVETWFWKLATLGLVVVVAVVCAWFVF
jgi:hypothetical protein